MSKWKLLRGSMTAFGYVLLCSVTVLGCSTTPSGESDPDKDVTKTEAKGKMTAAVYDRGNVPADQGTIADNWATKWINEAGPVDVKFVPIPRFSDTEKYNTLFAAGSAPDIVWSYGSDFKGQLINQRQAMPLEDLINESSTTYKKLLEDHPGLKKLTTDPDGHIYQIGRMNGLQPNDSLFIRADWLKALNLSVPQTTEELFEVAKAFVTQDPDGNGKNDTRGIAMSFITGSLIDVMFGNITPVVENDELVNGWDRKKDALAFKKQLFDSDIVNKDFLNDKDGAKAKEEWVTGNLGIYGGSIDGIDEMQVLATLMNNNPNAEVLCIPLPESEYGQFSGGLIPPIQVVGIVNADTKDPAAVMKYIDFLSDKASMTKLAYGDEGTDHTLTDAGFPALKQLDNPKFSWTNDVNLLYSPAFFGSVPSYINSLNLDNPIEKAWLELYEQAKQNYLSPDRPYPGFTFMEFRPVLPKELQTISSTVNGQIDNILKKAIVSGDSYTADQAIADAQKVWKQVGGEQIDGWWKDWYNANKETAYLTKDLYTK
ncbi:putative aldouronate transport system substrate-binding protein [Paenibacillus endophyticus]|uniref:Putative aldouronate transport system substrate-binding protein n=1 Tax=Paenibacillus endophyticus TaxID=1294268 RepID=A0A7W5CEM7_9BACL|nr:extracellular solute-binding protein [Paenibacillus endophyticus]MBB3156217.1 putative aldouronate transport system substrate-binding protein [Paenibacillus endophyticus]